MASILNSAILDSAILDSAILVFPLKLTHTCQICFQSFAQKNFIHSFSLNLMMMAILNSVMLDWDTAILDSDTLLFSLRFTQKQSHSTLTLTQTNSIWLKFIHPYLIWICQPAWILTSLIWPSWIQPSQYFLSNSFTLAKIGFHHLHKITLPFLSDSTWWWQSSWVIQTLPSWIETLCYLLSASLKNNLTPLKLMMAAIFNSAMLDSDTAILDSDTLLSSLRFTQKHSHSTLTLTQSNSIWLTWRWQPSGILPSWILPSWIQPICTKKILTHSFSLNLMMAAILNSAILWSVILHK